jgi:hypothetical protein
MGKMSKEELGYIVLGDDEYQKAISQLRMQMAGVFDFLKVEDGGDIRVRYLYGLDVYIPGAIDEAVKLAEDFGLRVRGVDKPISIDYVRRNKKQGVYNADD